MPRARFTTDKLKLAVEDAEKKVDRSRHAVVFGLAEKMGEKMEKEVEEPFVDLKEKPQNQEI